MSKYSFALREGAEHKSKETGTGLRGLWKYSFPICAGILILLLLGVSSRVELLYDELTYVIGGATALRNFATLTFAPEFWSFEFHPPFMMYFYGLAFGAYVVVRTLFTKGWVSIDELTIQAAILAKDETTIQFFRIPSFIAGVLILYFVYRWGEKLLGNRTGAVCSMILLITLPPFIGMSSVAYLEIGMALLQLMAAYYFLSSLKEKNWNQYFLSAVLVGCAASTKIFAGVIGFVILVHMLYWGRKEAARRGMTFPEALQWLNRNKKVFLWFPIVPLVIYIAWPWLWTDPSLFFKNLF
ncbi:MAG: ArnT family glycosyltransferase, partial [Nitrospinales bacterium]